MGYLLIALAVWAIAGAVVATFVVPWRDIAVHARWAPMRLEADAPPSSPWYVGAAFWFVCAALWPFAWRWVRLGVFAGSNETPMAQVPPENP